MIGLLFQKAHMIGLLLQKAHVIGLPGEGQIELPSPDLPREASVLFSFRSQQSDALMLLAIGSKPDVCSHVAFFHFFLDFFKDD